MGRQEWDNEAWEQIADDDRIWAAFDEQYHFRPGMDPATWPAIVEPAGSVTFDLSPVFARDARTFGLDKAALERLVLGAFTDTFADGTRLVVLDWQHVSRWFWPHRHQQLGEPWRVEPFPDGDYHVFLTEDLGQGIFGAPLGTDALRLRDGAGEQPRAWAGRLAPGQALQTADAAGHLTPVDPRDHRTADSRLIMEKSGFPRPGRPTTP